jgi:hypothetical protein
VYGGGIIFIKQTRQRIKQRQLDEKKEIARYKALIKRTRKAYFEQFQAAAALTRIRIETLNLRDIYLLED